MEFIHRRYKNIPLLIKVKFLNTKFYENPSTGVKVLGLKSRTNTDRQTDMAKLIGA
jgi:hypothetical protein